MAQWVRFTTEGETRFGTLAHGIITEYSGDMFAAVAYHADVAGLSEDVNRSSAEAMLWTFAENTILPKLRLIEAQLTQDLCPAFGEGIIASFANPVPDSREEERQDMIARLQYGVTTPAEERLRLGLAPVKI